MLNIVIPMAGNGQRFVDAGYKDPKPLVPVLGVPMIKRVMDNLTPSCEHRFILITRKKDNIDGHIQMRSEDHIIELDRLTQGAVSTVLKSKRFIDNDDPLLLANCDQLAKIRINDLIDEDGDGAIAIFSSSKPHHSYVTLDDELFVNRIVEKAVISLNAVTGIYYFTHGKDFVTGAEYVIRHRIQALNEFYISTVIQRMIDTNYKFRTIGAPVAILGTPEELQLFETAAQVGKDYL